MQRDAQALSDVQREAVRLSVAGTRPGEVARTLGVDPATVSRWRALPAFRDALEVSHRETDDGTLSDLRRRLVNAAGIALDVLLDVALDDSAPASARVSAARSILDRALPVLAAPPTFATGLGIVPRGFDIPQTVRDLDTDELRRLLAQS